MPRGFQINGESLVLVKGRADSAIGSLTQLGLSDADIDVDLEFMHEDIKVDAWGEAPPELQFFLAAANITMTLVHFDPVVLDVCIAESMAGAPAVGSTARAGALMGNGLPRFAPGGAFGNHFIGLNIASPVAGKPWRFYYAYLARNPVKYPLGTKRTITQLNWRAIPYTVDPWNGGLGATGAVIWDNVLDT